MPIAAVAIVDVIVVLVFVVIGRRNHDEALSLAGLATTAWPFLVGLAAGWLAARAWTRPLRIWPTAVVIWLVTLVVGMVLRAVSGQGTAFSFMIVATLFLAFVLLGWRLAAALFIGRRLKY